jgi:mannose-6-phosphate isomerase-like protein (cupin superfamily)
MMLQANAEISTGGGDMEWHSWIQQVTPHTTVQRGGPTVWPKGASGLIGDSLGPLMHIHDDASEVFYFLSGTCRMETGNTEELFGAGDFVLVPPLVPHNLWNGGDDDLVVFWLVAPNFVDNKWRTDNFPPGAMDGRVERGRIPGTDPLPADHNIGTTRHAVDAHATESGETGPKQEMILYVLEGRGELKLDGAVSPLHRDSISYIPRDRLFKVSAAERLSYLAFRTPAS